MRKALKTKLMEPYGLIEAHKNVFTGKLGIYHMSILIDEYNKQYQININGKVGEQSPRKPMEDFLSELKSENRSILKASYQDHHIALKGRTGISLSSGIKKIHRILEEVKDYLSANQYQTGCGICGIEDDTLSLASIKGEHRVMCNSCYQKITDELDNKKVELMERKGNIIFGLVGALLGALIGGALWVIIAQMGYISAIAGIITVVCAFKGYQFFGGKVSLMGAVLCMLICLGVIFAAGIVDWAIVFYDYFKVVYDVTFLEVLRETPALISEYQEDLQTFIRDLLVGYAFTLVVGIPTMIAMYKESQGHYDAVKL